MPDIDVATEDNVTDVSVLADTPIDVSVFAGRGAAGPVGPSGLQNYMTGLTPVHADVGKYLSTVPPGPGASRALPTGVVIATPFIPGADLTIDRIGFRISTWAQGRTARIGVYDSNALGNLPGNLLAELAYLSVTTGPTVEIVTDFSFQAGKQYWLAIEPTIGTGSEFTVQGVIFTGYARRYPNTQAEAYSQVNNNLCAVWARPVGPLPAVWGGTTYGSEIIPGFAMRRSA